MRAVIIAGYGGPEVLELREVPLPAPASGELLVRVRATALNRADLLQRRGKYPGPTGAPAEVPGLEFAGEVVESGPGVSGFTEGERVYGIVGGGAHAEYLTVPASSAARVPRTLDWEQAGCVPEAFITAHDAMVEQAHIAVGESVLIHAVGSGVGLAAVQLARAFGAVPYGTARRADKIDRALGLGLEDGLVVTDVSAIPEAIERWTGGRGMNVVLDLVGGDYLGASIAGMAPGARLMLIGTVAGATAALPLGRVLRGRLRIIGTVLRSRSVAEKAAATAAFVRDVHPLLDSGSVRPIIDSVFSLDDIQSAHERLESNDTFGKVALLV
jgi:putative PIG3 family NAD(P)H quinone oxidoreductase